MLEKSNNYLINKFHEPKKYCRNRSLPEEKKYGLKDYIKPAAQDFCVNLHIFHVGTTDLSSKKPDM